MYVALSLYTRPEVRSRKNPLTLILRWYLVDVRQGKVNFDVTRKV